MKGPIEERRTCSEKRKRLKRAGKRKVYLLEESNVPPRNLLLRGGRNAALLIEEKRGKKDPSPPGKKKKSKNESRRREIPLRGTWTLGKVHRPDKFLPRKGEYDISCALRRRERFQKGFWAEFPGNWERSEVACVALRLGGGLKDRCERPPFNYFE